MATPPYYFGHRAPSPKRTEGLLKCFKVQCGRCNGERLRVVSDRDSDTGEMGIFLLCQCGQREKIPVQ